MKIMINKKTPVAKLMAERLILCYIRKITAKPSNPLPEVRPYYCTNSNFNMHFTLQKLKINIFSN
jgi:hypothetical protein